MNHEDIKRFADAKIYGHVAPCCLEGDPAHEQVIGVLCQFFLDRVTDSPKWLNRRHITPQYGQRVLVWSPAYREPLIAYYARENVFYETHNGETVDLNFIEWWMPLPESPAPLINRKTK